MQKYILKNGGVLQADEMGLGKTIQVIDWIRQYSTMTTVILCPANAKYDVWEKEIVKWLGFRPLVLEGRKSRPIGGNEKIIVVNYDIIDAWAKEISHLRISTVVFDEVHYLSNVSSARYRALDKLLVNTVKKGRKVVKRTSKIPSRIGMSGTPVNNKPADLYGSLSLIWPQYYTSPWKFYFKYSRPYRYHNRWIVAGSRNKPKLWAELKKRGMVRRLKEEVLKIPKKDRRIQLVTLRRWSEYQFAENQFREWIIATRSIRKARKTLRAETLVKVGYLLRLSAKLKMNRIGNWIDSFLEDTDRKLIVFSYITPLIHALEKRYGDLTVKITGQVTGRKRSKAISRFQHDKTCRIALCNGKAAGVALTLTAASDVLGTDLPWNPAILLQAEDRAHRFGQKRQVVITYLIGKGTMDEHVMNVLASKQKDIDNILSGKDGRDSKELTTMTKSMYKELVSRVLKKGKHV